MPNINNRLSQTFIDPIIWFSAHIWFLAHLPYIIHQMSKCEQVVPEFRYIEFASFQCEHID